MADDVTLNSMSGGSVVSTDQAGDGSHVQIVKLGYSADGSRTHVDADSSGLKVNLSNASVTVALGSALPAGSNVIGAVTQSGSWTVGVSGTVAATQSGAWTVAATQSGTWNINAITTLPALASGSNTIGAVTQASGPWTTVERGATINHGATTVTTTQVSLISAGTTRRSVTIQNLGTDYIYIGATGITANNGLRVSPGQTAVIDKSPNAQIFAIAASGTQNVSLFWESD